MTMVIPFPVCSLKEVDFSGGSYAATAQKIHINRPATMARAPSRYTVQPRQPQP